jgi:ketosteroid isomerase-like protein
MKSLIPPLAATILAIALSAHTSTGDEHPKGTNMTKNKATIEQYMEGFRRSDHAMVLACLTEDVEWVIPGMFQVRGQQAFDKEIENEAFVGSPAITITRMTEESDVVVAEGTVQSGRKDGGKLNVVFCDVFEMKDGKIRKLTSYLMEVKVEK